MLVYLPARPVLDMNGGDDRPTDRPTDCPTDRPTDRPPVRPEGGVLGSTLLAGLLVFTGFQHRHTIGPWAQGSLAHDFIDKSVFCINRPLVRDIGIILPAFCSPRCCAFFFDLKTWFPTMVAFGISFKNEFCFSITSSIVKSSISKTVPSSA